MDAAAPSAVVGAPPKHVPPAYQSDSFHPGEAFVAQMSFPLTSPSNMAVGIISPFVFFFLFLPNTLLLEHAHKEDLV